MTQRRDVLASSARWVDPALWAFAVLCAASTLYFSLGATPPGTEAFPLADKVWHFTAYMVSVAAFLFAAVWRPGRGPGRFSRAAPFVVIGALAIGGLIEILQGSYFSRTMDPSDALADLAGALAAYVAWRAAGRMSSRA